MTLRVVFRHAAKREFEDAAAWYKERRSGLSEEFIHAIDDAIARAAAAPQRFPIVWGGIRRTVTQRFPFAVYFRVRSDALVVLAVIHGRRDPIIWQRRV